MLGSLDDGASVEIAGESVDIAAERENGGGPFIPSGIGALVWEYSATKFLPSDNLDARSCSVVGALVDGILYGSGVVVNLAFTTDGGAPTVGQQVWLASSQDDANTGRGKATATQPSTAMPVYPLFTQNIVPIGICVNNSHYGIDGTCQVRLAMPTHPAYVVPSNQTFNLRRATGLQVGNTFIHDGNAAASIWGNNNSIFVAFTVDQIATTAHESVFFNTDPGGAGWAVFCDSSVLVVNEGVALMSLGQQRPGLNIVCATRTGGTFRASLNGGPVVTMADPGTQPGEFATLGFDWTRGGVTAAAMLNRALSDGELAAFSGWNNLMVNSVSAPVNYFAPPPALTADSACRWYTDLTAWPGGVAPVAVAGPSGPGFVWTLVGTPTSTAFSYTWNRNPQELYLDGPPPSYDTKHLSRDRQLQRIAFTANTVFDVGLFVVGFSLDDTDNGDEGALAVLINGQPLVPIGAAEDGVTRYSPFWFPDNGIGGAPFDVLAGLTAPYHVEIIMSDKITRIDTFDSGGAIASLITSDGVTFDTSATAKRLVVVGDGETYGGHSADLPTSAIGGGAVITRIRADYPGRVSAFGVQATQSILKIIDWGNGSPLPYADYVVQFAHEGAPTTVVYLFGFGLMDWFESLPLTVPQFAVALAQFIDRLHTLDASAAFAIAKPVQTALYANVNSNGETLQSFADAIGTVAAARPWLTLVDLTTPNAITFTGSPLAINPEMSAGQIALKNNVKAAPVVGY
jgi:hypothetical protein